MEDAKYQELKLRLSAIKKKSKHLSDDKEEVEVIDG